MSLSSLPRFKRSNEGLEVENISISHVLAFLIRHSFTEIKHHAKGSNKITMYKNLLLLKFSKCKISR